MAKGRGSSNSGEGHYTITQANLDRKGKTNKKVSRNVNSGKYLSATGKELREKAAAYAKEHFKKGRRTLAKQRAAEEAAKKAEERAKQSADKMARKAAKNGQ